MSTNSKSLHPFITKVLRGYLTIAFPYLLVLIAVRLVMTPLFLTVEYTRPGFPDDYYGFTVQERLAYAPYMLQYLLNDENIEFLANLRLPDGSDMFNVRELQHMRDVKLVTQIGFLLAAVGGAMAVLAVRALRYLDPPSIRVAIFRGSVLTLSLITAIVLVAIFSWDTFFTTFHRLFFEGGTWQFAYADTLIRLFPEQLWFDAALAIGGFAVIVSLIVIRLSTR